MKRLIIFGVLILLLTSCSEQKMKRNFGGNMTIELPAGERLMSAGWDQGSLFYLTEPSDSTYQPKIKIFRESSSLGIAEVTVKFIEQ